MARNDKIVVAPGIQVDLVTAYNYGQNQFTETFDRKLGGIPGSLLTSGTLITAAAPVREGDAINTLYTFNTGAGTAVTSYALCIYDRLLNLVANSADVKANLGTTWTSAPLATAWTAPYTGIAYFGVFCIFVTTSPNVLTAPTALSTGQGLAPAAGIGRVSWGQAGLGALPATATPAASVVVPYVLAA